MDDFYDPLPTYGGNPPSIVQDKDDSELLESLLMDIDGPPLMVPIAAEITPTSVVPIKQEHQDIVPPPSVQPVAPEANPSQKRALGKDDQAKLLKKQRRLVRNRMSAQLHRERKKAQLDNLEHQLKQKTNECDALTTEVTELKLENASLRVRLSHFTGDSVNASSSGESTPPSQVSTDTSSSPDDSSSMSDDSSSSPPQSPQPHAPLSVPARGAILFSFVISFMLFADPVMQNSVDADIQSRLLAAPLAAQAPKDVLNPGANPSVSPFSNALVPRAPGARVLNSMETEADREANEKENQMVKAEVNAEVPWHVGRENQLYPRSNNTALNHIAHEGKFHPSTQTAPRQPLSMTSSHRSPQERSTSTTKTLRGRRGSTSVTTTMVESQQVEWKNFPGNVNSRSGKSTSHDFVLPEFVTHDIPGVSEHPRSNSGSYILCPEAYGTVNIWTGEDVAVSEPNVGVGPTDSGAKKIVDPSVDSVTSGGEQAGSVGAGTRDIERVLAGGQYYRDAAMNMPEVDNSRALAPIAPKTSHAREPLQAPTPEGTDYSGEGQQHPYMLMLVPTRSVRWGGRALNNDSTGENEEEDEEASTTWLEIGCQVLHARVVSNVKFTAM